MEFKFNIGDKIKASKDGDGYKSGDIRVVSAITSSWVYVNGDGSNSGDGKAISNFDLHEPAAPQKPAIDWTKPVETQSGEPFAVLSTQARGDYPVIGHVGESEAMRSYTIDGKYVIGEDSDPADLRNVPAKPMEVTAFLNLYVNGMVTRHTTRGAAETPQDWREHGDVIGRKLVTVVAGTFD